MNERIIKIGTTTVLAATAGLILWVVGQPIYEQAIGLRGNERYHAMEQVIRSAHGWGVHERLSEPDETTLEEETQRALDEADK